MHNTIHIHIGIVIKTVLILILILLLTLVPPYIFKLILVNVLTLINASQIMALKMAIVIEMIIYADLGNNVYIDFNIAIITDVRL